MSWLYEGLRVLVLSSWPLVEGQSVWDRYEAY